jgi:pyridoxamine 5'-phosphate oxidase
MEFRDCVQFANDHPYCHLATADGDQPRVRVINMWFANEEGFYFCGLAPKNVWEQIQANPKVEICFFNNAPQVADVKTLRVTGQAEFLEDPELKAKVLEARPFYKNFGTGEPDDPTYPVVRVAHGEAWFWTMDYVLREAEAERIRF